MCLLFYLRAADFIFVHFGCRVENVFSHLCLWMNQREKRELSAHRNLQIPRRVTYFVLPNRPLPVEATTKKNGRKIKQFSNREHRPYFFFPLLLSRFSLFSLPVYLVHSIPFRSMLFSPFPLGIRHFFIFSASPSFCCSHFTSFFASTFWFDVCWWHNNIYYHSWFCIRLLCSLFNFSIFSLFQFNLNGDLNLEHSQNNIKH